MDFGCTYLPCHERVISPWFRLHLRSLSDSARGSCGRHLPRLNQGNETLAWAHRAPLLEAEPPVSLDRPVVVNLDRAYDQRLLNALPSTLKLFARNDLQAQLAAMSLQRRAICFTLMAPVRLMGERRPASSPSRESVAVVLVCLHVSPDLAARGVQPVMAVIETVAAQAAEPLHEMAAPLTRAGHIQTTGFYREAIYPGDDECYVAMTTHAPADIPPEAAAAVAQATKGGPVDVVTTVAITPYQPEIAAALKHRRPSARPTLH